MNGGTSSLCERSIRVALAAVGHHVQRHNGIGHRWTVEICAVSAGGERANHGLAASTTKRGKSPRTFERVVAEPGLHQRTQALRVLGIAYVQLGVELINSLSGLEVES